MNMLKDMLARSDMIDQKKTTEYDESVKIGKILAKQYLDPIVKKIEKFQLNNKNDYLSKKINEVKSRISELNTENINDSSIIKFLTVTKLIEELEE